jgi:protease IV
VRGLIRFLGGVAFACISLVVISLTISFIRDNWFGRAENARKNNVGVLDLSGTIMSSSQFLKQLEDLTEKQPVKAIVVRINSPGGLVGPSQELFEGIKKADAKVPIIASLSSVAASGGYYAALGARKIFSNPGTLTGSIGVIMEFVNAERLLEWARVERFTLKAGKLKDAGSPFRKMTPEEREYLNSLLAEVHKQFKGAVKERRKLADADLERVTDGRIMTGSQAKEAKLIDELGGFNEALKEAKKLAGLPDDAVVEYPQKKRGLLRQLLWGEEEEGSETNLSRFTRAILGTTPSPGWRVLLLAPLSLP